MTDTGMPTELVAKVAAIGRVIDPVPFVDQANELRDALCRSARGCQGFLVLAKHNHLTQVQSINTADSTLTRHVLDFVK